jgi:hypothetical protein
LHGSLRAEDTNKGAIPTHHFASVISRLQAWQREMTALFGKQTVFIVSPASCSTVFLLHMRGLKIRLQSRYVALGEGRKYNIE